MGRKLDIQVKGTEVTLKRYNDMLLWAYRKDLREKAWKTVMGDKYTGKVKNKKK